jgi:hypothetical protein
MDADLKVFMETITSKTKVGSNRDRKDSLTNLGDDPCIKKKMMSMFISNEDINQNGEVERLKEKV